MGMHPAPRHLDSALYGGWNRLYAASEELAVGKWGDGWALIDRTTGSALTGCVYETRADAIEEAQRRVDRGDYR